MARTLTIEIAPVSRVLAEFRDAFNAVKARRPVTRREDVYFTSLEAALNLLTPTRLALLRAVRAQRPGSIHELARIVGRDRKNIAGDLRALRKHGLVRMANTKGGGKRRGPIPRAVFDEIALKIAI